MLDKVIAALEAKKQQQAVSVERFVREQRILDGLAPRVWRELREAFKAGCKKHPDYLTFTVQRESYVCVRCANRRVLEVEFLDEARTIAFQCGDASGEYVIGLDETNRAAIFDGDGKTLPSPAYLADELLTLVVCK